MDCRHAGLGSLPKEGPEAALAGGPLGGRALLHRRGDLPAGLGRRGSTCLQRLSGDGAGVSSCSVGIWVMAAALGVFRRTDAYK